MTPRKATIIEVPKLGIVLACKTQEEFDAEIFTLMEEKKVPHTAIFTTVVTLH